MSTWESSFFVFTPGIEEKVSKITLPAQTLPKPTSIEGKWKMRLERFGFTTYEKIIPKLSSWTFAERTRHFSGTGGYEIEFELPQNMVGSGARMILDLGEVGNIAEVKLNGKSAGVAWMAPYRIDITNAVLTGKNKLLVSVTNTLINYVSGLEKPPEVPVKLHNRLGKADPAIYK